MDTGEQLSGLSKRIEVLKEEKARVDGRIESLTTQRKSVIDRCRELDIDPEKLDDEIELRSNSLDNLIQSVERAVTNIESSRDEIYKREQDTNGEAVGGRK